MNNYKHFITLFAFLILTLSINAQDTIPYKKGASYELGGIAIKGLKKFSEQTVKVYSGLKTGQVIKIPGDKLTSAIKKLYSTKQFSNVDVYVTKIVDKVAYLEFDVVELPEISTITITGLKKGKADELKKEAGLKKGEMVTDNLLITTKNYIQEKYAKNGFLKSKVTINTKKDTSQTNAVKMLIHIDNGERVKIKNINFHGNSAFRNKKLSKAMSNTKRKVLGRFWKKSKFIEEEFEEDLESIIEKYSEKGYRDAHITDKKITWNDDNTLNLDITLDEGKQYRFGSIKFVGNSKFTDQQLQRFLRIEKGDIYNSKVLKERVNGDGTPDSQDISSTYLNRGYMAAQVNPVETRVNNDSIDVEIRIFEGQPFTLKNITVVGNNKTNDHVIFRELRTKPGQLFSKEDIIRSIRELGQLGFFDAETISPDVKPNYADQTTDIEYSLNEKGSSQIELQGGYGNGAFIGTLGLTFNNFSIRNIFNKKAYKPLPMGDGQALSLRLQTSKYYSTYSFSFTEPWLGGKKPKSLSFSIYNSRQFQYNYSNRNVDKSQKINILGASIGLGQRLKWPDDYFTLSQTVSIQQYTLKNYRISTFSFDNGTSNNIAYAINLGRSSAGPGRIFPQTGSDFSLGLKLTPPYSLFQNKDYASISDDEKYNFLEYYKVSFKGKWYTPLFNKVVLVSNTEFGFLGNYNNKLGDSPFERYYVGGDGMATNQFDGRETVALRGYENSSLSNRGGGTIYNKFSLEMRYPITLKPSASIYTLAFVEGGNSYDGIGKFNPFNVKRSAGLGMRIFMPAFGLLGIDFAHGFDSVAPGLPKSGWQTHFIIGQQF